MSTIKEKSVKIIDLDSKNGKLIMNNEHLDEVFKKNKELMELPVVVISIVGAYRTGKSFLLNFILKYLHCMYKSPGSKKNTSNWLKADGISLKGFDWARGKTRVTQGIQMWPEIFCATLPNGEKVAILLLDTQGLFDHKTDTSGNSNLFALSSAISSVQIFNVKERIQMDDLQHLELFTALGSGITKMGGDAKRKPFQNLLFLVRDWCNADENAYGLEGGKQYVDEILDKSINENKSSEKNEAEPESLHTMRQHICACFNEIGGFLMPEPGKKVKSDPEFTGDLSDIDEDFVKCLRELIPSLLSPEHLVPKTINGGIAKLKNLYQYIESVVENLNKMDAPKSICEANAESSYRMAYEASLERFKRDIGNLCNGSPLSDADFLVKIEKECKCVRKVFNDHPKFGGEQYEKKYLQKLNEELEMLANSYFAVNEKKRAINLLSKDLEAKEKKLAAQALEMDAKEEELDYIRREKKALEKEYHDHIAELAQLRKKLEEEEDSPWKPRNIVLAVAGTAVAVASGAAVAMGGRAVVSLAARYALPAITGIVAKYFKFPW